MPQPKVKLMPQSKEIMDTVVATARTCYASKPILPEEVTKDEKSRAIAEKVQQSTKKAGHNTTRLHKSLTFKLEDVSRQFIWSFLHAHPFYNSEQVSQRYVDVKPGTIFIPELEAQSLDIYLTTANRQMDAYKKLGQMLTKPAEDEYYKIFPARKSKHEKWKQTIHKKAIESARYLLPIATFAHLYHTISPLTLIRYKRMCEASDVPKETRMVVDKMVEQTLQLDKRFEKDLDETIPLEETLEYECLKRFGKANLEFKKEFDADLGSRTSKLTACTTLAEHTLASAVRTALGLAKTQLSDKEAIELALNPAENKYLGEIQNVMTMSKITRALHTVTYTFQKKLSHTADSQDQRHRMTPAARPILATQYTGEPDYITPALIQQNEQAKEFYDKEIKIAFDAINKMIDLGTPLNDALYLLPNAFTIRFYETADLLNLHHKHTQRLCYTAQEEIWQASKEEAEQITNIHPNIGKFLHAPCWQRKHAKQTPYCPEGDRYCGVPVWNLEVKDFKRII